MAYRVFRFLILTNNRIFKKIPEWDEEERCRMRSRRYTILVVLSIYRRMRRILIICWIEIMQENSICLVIILWGMMIPSWGYWSISRWKEDSEHDKQALSTTDSCNKNVNFWFFLYMYVCIYIISELSMQNQLNRGLSSPLSHYLFVYRLLVL